MIRATRPKVIAGLVIVAAAVALLASGPPAEANRGRKAAAVDVARRRAAAAGPARSARRPTRQHSRVHVLTPEYLRRLSPGARRNIAAVGQIRYRAESGWENGSAFIAHVCRSGRVFAFTTMHGVDAMVDGAALVMEDGTRGSMTGVVWGSRRLDAALIELEIPDPPPPVQLSSAGLETSDVYMVGYGHVDKLGPDDLAINRRTRQPILNAQELAPLATLDASQHKIRYPKWIALGRVTGARWVTEFRRVNVDEITVPHAPGSSGSLVASAADHRVVAIHHSGFKDVNTGASSDMASVMAGLFDHLHAGTMPSHATEVARMLARNGFGRAERARVVANERTFAERWNTPSR